MVLLSWKMIARTSLICITALQATFIQAAESKLCTAQLSGLEMPSQHRLQVPSGYAESKLFSGHELIQLRAECETLSAGEHVITVIWSTQAGGVVRHSAQDIYIAQENNGTSNFFGLKLMELGSVTQTFSGSTFPKHFQSQWTAHVMLNGQTISKHAFRIL